MRPTYSAISYGFILHRLAVLLEPHDRQDRPQFLSRLRAARLSSRSRELALAADHARRSRSRILAEGQAPLKFIEQVEYNGRRLAKLNLPPSAILEALQEYDRLLTPALEYR